MNARVVETVTAKSIRITLGRETDGRWWADVDSMPGVWRTATQRNQPSPPCEPWPCALLPTALTTARRFRLRSQTSFLPREPMAVGQSEAPPGSFTSDRMDHSLAERISSLAQADRMAELHVRVSRRRRNRVRIARADWQEDRAAARGPVKKLP